MKKFMQKRLKNEKGMTLIELLAVIVILAIIAAIAIPAIGNIIENSRVGAIKSDAQNVLSSANLYFTENTGNEVKISELIAKDYLDNAGSLDVTDTSVVNKGTTGLPNTISTVGDNKGVKLTFKNASSKMITDATEVKAGGTIE